jgi:molybdopterin synthase sulfur carrier subunit
MPVKVNIRLLGVFRGLSSKSQLSLRLKKPTVRSVVLKLSESLSVEAKRLLVDPELDDPRPNALILVNGKEINVLKGLETELEDDDEVTLIPVSHGG